MWRSKKQLAAILIILNNFQEKLVALTENSEFDLHENKWGMIEQMLTLLKFSMSGCNLHPDHVMTVAQRVTSTIWLNSITNETQV